MLKFNRVGLTASLLSMLFCLVCVGCGGETPAGPGDANDIPAGGDPAMEASVDDGSGNEDKPPGVE